MTKEELLQELTILIKDEFVAVYTSTDSGLQMKFPSGQTFVVTLEEIS